MENINESVDIAMIEKSARTHMGGIIQARYEISKTQDEINSKLMTDEEFRRLDTEIKRLQELRKQAKSKVMKQPEMMEQNKKLREMKKEARVMKQTLSELLDTYVKITGKDTIEDHLGRTMLIKKNMTAEVRVPTMEGLST